jgi:arabinogalactan oligomer/maltooligosaccharide transport system permease protein
LLNDRVYGLLMALPTTGLAAFTVLPLIFMITMAFTSFDKGHPVAFNWVGLKNFATVLSSNGSSAMGVNLKLFVAVLIWTLCWAFFATFLNFFIGMFMAMIILRAGTRIKGFWRACFSMSIAIPQFVSLLVINSMLQDQGIVNQMLKNWGLIDSSLPFFTNAWWARATVIVVNLWIGIPYTIMQITGILQNIPGETLEAAKIDGANWWQRYRYVTMPYILFVMTPYLITTFTANVNNFNIIYLLSNGDPTRVGESAGQTDLLITWLYKLTVDKGNYNVGAVIGILTFIVLAVVALITYRSSGSYKNEEGFR